jgi:hypothetical protein
MFYLYLFRYYIIVLCVAMLDIALQIEPDNQLSTFDMHKKVNLFSSIGAVNEHTRHRNCLKK